MKNSTDSVSDTLDGSTSLESVASSPVDIVSSDGATRGADLRCD